MKRYYPVTSFRNSVESRQQTSEQYDTQTALCKNSCSISSPTDNCRSVSDSTRQDHPEKENGKGDNDKSTKQFKRPRIGKNGQEALPFSFRAIDRNRKSRLLHRYYENTCRKHTTQRRKFSDSDSSTDNWDRSQDDVCSMSSDTESSIFTNEDMEEFVLEFEGDALDQLESENPIGTCHDSDRSETEDHHDVSTTKIVDPKQGNQSTATFMGVMHLEMELAIPDNSDASDTDSDSSSGNENCGGEDVSSAAAAPRNTVFTFSSSMPFAFNSPASHSNLPALPVNAPSKSETKIATLRESDDDKAILTVVTGDGCISCCAPSTPPSPSERINPLKSRDINVSRLMSQDARVENKNNIPLVVTRVVIPSETVSLLTDTPSLLNNNQRRQTSTGSFASSTSENFREGKGNDRNVPKEQDNVSHDEAKIVMPLEMINELCEVTIERIDYLYSDNNLDESEENDQSKIESDEDDLRIKSKMLDTEDYNNLSSPEAHLMAIMGISIVEIQKMQVAKRQWSLDSLAFLTYFGVLKKQKKMVMRLIRNFDGNRSGSSSSSSSSSESFLERNSEKIFERLSSSPLLQCGNSGHKEVLLAMLAVAKARARFSKLIVSAEDMWIDDELENQEETTNSFEVECNNNNNCLSGKEKDDNKKSALFRSIFLVLPKRSSQSNTRTLKSYLEAAPYSNFRHSDDNEDASLNQRPPSLGIRMYIMHQLVLAVGYLHAHGIYCGSPTNNSDKKRGSSNSDNESDREEEPDLEKNEILHEKNKIERERKPIYIGADSIYPKNILISEDCSVKLACFGGGFGIGGSGTSSNSSTGSNALPSTFLGGPCFETSVGLRTALYTAPESIPLPTSSHFFFTTHTDTASLKRKNRNQSHYFSGKCCSAPVSGNQVSRSSKTLHVNAKYQEGDTIEPSKSIPSASSTASSIGISSQNTSAPVSDATLTSCTSKGNGFSSASISRSPSCESAASSAAINICSELQKNQFDHSAMTSNQQMMFSDFNHQRKDSSGSATSNNEPYLRNDTCEHLDEEREKAEKVTDTKSSNGNTHTDPTSFENMSSYTSRNHSDDIVDDSHIESTQFRSKNQNITTEAQAELTKENSKKEVSDEDFVEKKAVETVLIRQKTYDTNSSNAVSREITAIFVETPSSSTFNSRTPTMCSVTVEQNSGEDSASHEINRKSEIDEAPKYSDERAMGKESPKNDKNDKFVPEQRISLPSSNSKTDIWTLGCIMGELIMCKPIFEAKSGPINALEAILEVLGNTSAFARRKDVQPLLRRDLQYERRVTVTPNGTRLYNTPLSLINKKNEGNLNQPPSAPSSGIRSDRVRAAVNDILASGIGYLTRNKITTITPSSAPPPLLSPLTDTTSCWTSVPSSPTECATSSFPSAFSCRPSSASGFATTSESEKQEDKQQNCNGYTFEIQKNEVKSKLASHINRNRVYSAEQEFCLHDWSKETLNEFLSDELRLLGAMLNPDPDSRPTITEILNHPYFTEMWVKDSSEWSFISRDISSDKNNIASSLRSLFSERALTSHFSNDKSESNLGEDENIAMIKLLQMCFEETPSLTGVNSTTDKITATSPDNLQDILSVFTPPYLRAPHLGSIDTTSSHTSSEKIQQKLINLFVQDTVSQLSSYQ